MNKYNFKDLKKEGVVLPEDCNSKAIEIADKLKSEDLKKSIKKIQSNKWYGTLNFYDKVGVMRAYFEFCAGMCIRIRLVMTEAPNIEFHMNVINNNISLKKVD